MKHASILLAPIGMVLGTIAGAQQPAGSDAAPFPAAFQSMAPGTGSYLAQYPVVVPGIDVEGALGVNGCLGVEHAWGYYWVSARGAPAAAGSHVIGQFTTAGALLSTTIQQNTGATSWGIRDLESDEAANKLWGGHEGGVLQEYDYVGGAAPLVFNQVHMIGPAVSGDIARGLARDPSTGIFYVVNLSSPIGRFTLNPFTMLSSLPSAGKIFYGLAHDRVNDTLWGFCQDNGQIVPLPPAGADLVELNEFDITTGALTGNGGWSVTHGVQLQNIAGGMDIYDDEPLNPGKLTFVVLHQFAPDTVYGLDLGKFTQTPAVVYCTAKLNSLGCTPAIAAVGFSSASLSSGFEVSAANVRNQSAGVLLYGNSGRLNVPFSGGTLCLRTPFRRAPATNSGGSPWPAADCSGVFSVDLNSFAQGLLAGTPAPFLTIAGSVVNCQWWGRDVGLAAPGNTTLTDALEFAVGP